MSTTTTVQSMKPHVSPWQKKEATRKHWACSRKGKMVGGEPRFSILIEGCGFNADK